MDTKQIQWAQTQDAETAAEYVKGYMAGWAENVVAVGFSPEGDLFLLDDTGAIRLMDFRTVGNIRSESVKLPTGTMCPNCGEDADLIPGDGETIMCGVCMTNFGDVAHEVLPDGTIKITDAEFYQEVFLANRAEEIATGQSWEPEPGLAPGDWNRLADAIKEAVCPSACRSEAEYLDSLADGMAADREARRNGTFRRG